MLKHKNIQLCNDQYYSNFQKTLVMIFLVGSVILFFSSHTFVFYNDLKFGNTFFNVYAQDDGSEESEYTENTNYENEEESSSQEVEIENFDDSGYEHMNEADEVTDNSDNFSYEDEDYSDLNVVDDNLDVDLIQYENEEELTDIPPEVTAIDSSEQLTDDVTYIPPEVTAIDSSEQLTDDVTYIPPEVTAIDSSEQLTDDVTYIPPEVTAIDSSEQLTDDDLQDQTNKSFDELINTEKPSMIHLDNKNLLDEEINKFSRSNDIIDPDCVSNPPWCKHKNVRWYGDFGFSKETLDKLDKKLNQKDSVTTRQSIP